MGHFKKRHSDFFKRLKLRAGSKEAGFTVFELILVILVSGILCLVQLHATGLIRRQFMKAVEKNIVSSVQVGIAAYFVDPKRGNLKKYPGDLDTESEGLCGTERKCFETVLPGGVTALWEKTSPFRYRSPAEERGEWTYEPETGTFRL